jgi:hypothetical protein
MENGINTESVFYLNPAQWLSYAVRAKKEVHVLGRGLGKTTGIQAPNLKFKLECMPRATCALVGASYMQLFTRIVPGVLEGWRNLGWIEGRDYWVGQYAPKNLYVDRPFKSPLKPEYVIHTRYGSALTLFSQDRPGMSNGVDIVSINADEAKFINKKQLDDELKPAMRGLEHLFGKLWCYHSEMYTSDMPESFSGMWLLEEKGSPKELIDEVLNLYEYTETYRQKLEGYQPSTRSRLEDVISQSDRLLNELRKRITLVNQASSLQNINILGPGWIKTMLDTLPPDEFKRSILTKKNLMTDTAFYNKLDWDRLSYHPKPSSYMLSLGMTFYGAQTRDCRIDEEFDWGENMLHIACDTGGSFNCLVCAIKVGDTINVYKAIFKRAPSMIRDVILMFKEYFVHWHDKRLVYHYDHTSIATRTETEWKVNQIVRETLESNELGSWHVTDNYIGQTPTYQWRYDVLNDMFHEHAFTPYVVRFNALHCEELHDSFDTAKVIQKEGKIEKDKSSERRDSKGNYRMDQARATHLSEAYDLLISGIVKQNTRYLKGDVF